MFQYNFWTKVPSNLTTTYRKKNMYDHRKKYFIYNVFNANLFSPQSLTDNNFFNDNYFMMACLKVRIWKII